MLFEKISTEGRDWGRWTVWCVYFKWRSDILGTSQTSVFLMNLPGNWQTISRIDWTQENVASIHKQASTLLIEPRRWDSVVWWRLAQENLGWGGLLHLPEPPLADLKNGDNNVSEGFVRIRNDARKMPSAVCGMLWSQGRRNDCHGCEHTPCTSRSRFSCTPACRPVPSSLAPALCLHRRSVLRELLLMSTLPLSFWKTLTYSHLEIRLFLHLWNLRCTPHHPPQIQLFFKSITSSVFWISLNHPLHPNRMPLPSKSGQTKLPQYSDLWLLS